MPTTIVSNRDSKLTSNILERIGYTIKFQHFLSPTNIWKIKRTNKIMQYMVYMYVIREPTKWKDYINLEVFTYNNGCQTSLNMNPFETHYGQRCNTQVS